MPNVRVPRRVITSSLPEISPEELSGRVSVVLWDDMAKPPVDILSWGDATVATPDHSLRSAVRGGLFGGPWLDGFPRYIWLRNGDSVREFRLVSRATGSYIGYALHPSEWPEEFP
jgi:hypothetical protein